MELWTLICMNKVRITSYETPNARLMEICLEGFLCTSIESMRFAIEVDEYLDHDEEILEF